MKNGDEILFLAVFDDYVLKNGNSRGLKYGIMLGR